MRIFTYCIFALILIVGVTFACLNAEPVAINYYIGKHSLPLSLLLVLSFAFGGLLGLLASFFMYIKQKAKIYKLNSRINTAEKEIANLRTMPLKNNR